MANIRLLKSDGKQGEIELAYEGVKLNEFNVSVVNRVRTQNQKQGTKHAKGRSEIRGHSAKPYRQKGTGNARQGSTKGPHMRGGGVSHGVKMDTRTLTLNKKFKNKVLVDLLKSLMESNCVVFVEPGIKKIVEERYNKSVFVYDKENKDTFRSIRNTPRMSMMNIESLSATKLTGYSRIYIDSSVADKIKKIVA